ncbi:MAG: ABC transporter permease [Siphonobacter aquaeclarae]|nr:ABC transporter permease [Siphonobacter aquaeclarae]
MNLPRFIASRIRSRTERRSFSSTVTRIGIASIAIGLAVMMVAFAVLFGFQGTVREKLFSLSAHMKVTRYTLNQSYEETALPRDSRLSRSYKTLPDIAHFQMVAHKAGILQTDEAVQGVLLKGVGPDFNWKSFGQNLTEGRLPEFGKDTTDSKEILISRSIANQLQLKTGDKVTLIIMQYPPRPRRLTVTGIYDTGLEELDKQLIIGDLRLVQKLNKWGPDTVGGYEIFVKDFDRIDQAVGQVSKLLEHDQDLHSVVKEYRALFDWLGMLDRNLGVFLTLILFVACFNMVSILLVLIMERIPMIGLLKALGSPNWQIRKIFLWQAVSMILKGLLFGNILGVGLCLVQQYFRIIPLDPENYYMSYVPIDMHWEIVVMLNIATLLLVLLVLTIPTFVISRMKPVEAIRFSK